MAKYDEVKGFIYGISDDEFEVLLKISFTLNNFKVEKIRRSSVVTNDFLLGLTRVEKRFLKGRRTYNYVAYVDRKRHEYSNKWMSNFWLRANSNEIYLHSTPDKEIEKILIMSVDKIKRKEIRKDLKENIKFFDGNKFFDFLFKTPPENISLISSLYLNESKKWDEMNNSKQKDFCEKTGVGYIEFQRLWKYTIDKQSKLIIALQDSGNSAKDRRDQREQEERERQERREQEEQERQERREQEAQERQERRRESTSSSESALKKYYDVLEVDENATSAEIKNAYREWIKFFHPDKFESKSPEDKERAMAKAKKMTVAYEELKKAGKVID